MTYTLSDNVEKLKLANGFAGFDANIDGTGNGLDNIITGNNDDNHLSGLVGVDFLYAGEGDDLLEGGTGDDELFASDGNDELRGGPDNDVYHVSWTEHGLLAPIRAYLVADASGDHDELDIVEVASLHSLNGINDLQFKIVGNDLWVGWTSGTSSEQGRIAGE